MKRPVTVLIEKGLMGALSAAWIIFGIITMGSDLVMGSFMILLGLVFGYYAFICRCGGGKLRIFLYVFVGANIAVALFDRMVFFDWAVLVLCIFLAAVMVYNDIKHKNVC